MAAVSTCACPTPQAAPANVGGASSLSATLLASRFLTVLVERRGVWTKANVSAAESSVTDTSTVRTNQTSRTVSGNETSVKDVQPLLVVALTLLHFSSGAKTNSGVTKAGDHPKSSKKESAPGKDAASCDLQVCHGHGMCVREGKVTRCKCSHGYKGESCQEAEKPSQVGVVLGVLCLVVALMAGAVILAKRRAWTLRSTSTEKETLMSSIVLSEPCDSDSEDMESPVDTTNLPLPLVSADGIDAADFYCT
ncbi:uncharacterized protein LOC117529103 [Thalassophryne amazonica]|uniref:uncharacterized protein LOC117529103 n=1 Tax=Thalassophryne amazonica TaxID=390379 RepID=UPI001471D354|nr:uncharacterized protein LOC117529103 [Thalassophryne amazonica]